MALIIIVKIILSFILSAIFLIMLIEQLKQYFKSATPEQLAADYELLKQYNNCGPTVEEYFKSLNIMTVKELKQILDKYSDNALVGVSIKTDLNVSFTLKEDTFYNNLILIAE